MGKRKRNVKWLSLTFTIMLIFSLLTPMNATLAATKKASSTSARESVVLNSKDRVSSKVIDQFKQKEKVTYLVKLKDQVDTTKVSENAASKAKSEKLSSLNTKLLKRSMVVSTLRAKATETQAHLKGYLQKEQKAGKVNKIQSFYVVNALAVTSTKDVMEAMAAFPEVDKVLPNEKRQLIQPTAVKNLEKEKSSLQLQPKNGTSSIEWNIQQIGAPQVWNMGIDGTGTVVATIDTGVQWDHPALKQKYRGYDPQNPDTPNNEFNWFDAVASQSSPYDDIGHGSHVTGTMVGSEPDGSNQIGVAPGAKWIAVKAFSPDGGTDVDLLEAGEWILAPKDSDGNPHPEKAPDVVNNSWGGGPGMDEWYRQMVQAWRAAEIFPEFSAGNTTLTNPGGPGSVATPANYPESFATGATDSQNHLASFSLQGPSPYNEMKPEISAPGVNIRSSVPGSTYEGGWNGTSMAGPHVSAVVALLKQADASLTVDEIEDILESTAVPLTDANFPDSPNNGYGHGLVNAFDAVSSVLSGIGKVKGTVTKEGEDTEAPVIAHEAPAQAFKEMALPLQADVSDNISVTDVKLSYMNEDGSWTDINAERVAGDYRSGTYEATIPAEALTGDDITYKWTAGDFGGNEQSTDEYTISLLPGISTGYEQDFEHSPIGWTSYGQANSWEWGAPSSGPGNAVSGEKVYGTNLDGNYDNSGNMTLLMPPVDLPDGESYLQFKQWYELERNYDYGHVFISTDMENWTQALRVNGTTDGWVDGEVDLSQYAGQRIYIAFNVTTDSSVVKQGWYLDDVKLSDQSLQPAKKIDLGVKPKNQDKSASLAAKPKVYPDKIMPIKPANEEKPSTDPAPMLLPLQAQVSVLETGRSVYTDPKDGSYELSHAAGDYTLKAEAYGYRSETQQVSIEQDGITTADFTLEEIPKGTISGMVTNEATGEPLEGATLFVLEDAAIQPVQTDENGHYDLQVYEGDYTLKIVAPHYYSQEVSVTVNGGEVETVDVAMKPFIGYGGEIGYDDGTAENARAFYDAGNGWGVKMSLADGQDKALVTGGLFRFWDTEWPVPGGTDFKVEVYDASGSDGAPGKKIAGPINATALRNGEWTQVDLSGEGIMVDGDFYMVYIQSDPNPNAPGLATDEDGENAGRSWQYVDGAWSPSPEDEGNYMIRALVDYEVTAPVITSPKDGSFTNQKTVVVEGTSAPGTTVHILNNGEEASAVQATEEGTFSTEVDLINGENSLTAKASTEQGMTDESSPVVITLDQQKPELTITSPEDGLKTNKEAITVTGNVIEDNLAWVKVNGEKAEVSDGSFSHRILLNEGENVITVIAKDKAGNRKKQKVTVYSKQGSIVIDNLQPTVDKELKSGQTVKIEFDSEPGLKAVFTIMMPLTNTGAVQNANELPMMETSAGHYEGYYTATSNVKAPGAVIEVKASDDYGNVSTKRAEGLLYINTKKK
ncbi:S8 family peptidase [Falsibacillus albus]|uniref:Peptidase S8 n=1 Tax=Falsibacillus albus TaxID=2478915 RepID=A0A3L7K7M3_9BACI|nr:S8 family peptidase [Falsibacillus albus]RLQ98299.1 peptidase S8 [Falsibacillus albus]